MRRLAADTRALVLLTAVAVLAGMTLSLAACRVVMVLHARFEAEGIATMARDPALPGALALLALVVTRTVPAARPLLHTWRLRRWMRRAVLHDALPVPARVRRLAVDVGVRRLCLIADETVAAFTVGLVRPRVVVTTGLLVALDDEQLGAVLRHEAAHAERMDPLRRLVAHVAQGWTFFLPYAGHLRQRIVLGMELAADRSAVHHHGRRSVAAALIRLAAVAPVVVGFGAGPMLEARVRQLETGAEPPDPPMTGRVRVGTAVGLAAVIWMLLSSLLIAAPSTAGCLA